MTITDDELDAIETEASDGDVSGKRVAMLVAELRETRLFREKVIAIGGLTAEEVNAIDQWCYDEQRKRSQGIVSDAVAGRR